MDILQMTDPAQLESISVCAHIGRLEFYHIMRLLGLMWLYDGEPSADKPHAKLVSEMCSNCFLDVGALLKGHEKVRWNLANNIAVEIQADQIDNGRIDGVFGAPTSSTALAADVAELLGVMHYRLEKVESSIVWCPDQESVPTGARLLRVEDVVSLGTSCKMAMAAVITGNPDWEPNFYPTVFTIVDRSDPDQYPEGSPIEVQGSPVSCQFRIAGKIFEPATCPYHAVGSPAWRPKDHRKIFFPPIKKPSTYTECGERHRHNH